MGTMFVCASNLYLPCSSLSLSLSLNVICLCVCVRPLTHLIPLLAISRIFASHPKCKVPTAQTLPWRARLTSHRQHVVYRHRTTLLPLPEIIRIQLLRCHATKRITCCRTARRHRNITEAIRRSNTSSHRRRRRNSNSSNSSSNNSNNNSNSSIGHVPHISNEHLKHRHVASSRPSHYPPRISQLVRSFVHSFPFPFPFRSLFVSPSHLPPLHLHTK